MATAIEVGQTITIQQYADADNRTLAYYRNAYLFFLDITLNYQDVVNNVSNVTIKHRMTPKKSYYSLYNGIGSRLNVDSAQVASYDLHACSLNTNYILTEYTDDIVHDSVGNLSLDVSAQWHGFDSNNNYAPVSNNIEETFTFPQILRTSGLTVTPALLQPGDTLSISLTRYVPSYRDTVSWNANGGTEHILQTKGSATSLTVPYSTIEAVLGTHTSGTINVSVETFSGSTSLGRATKAITVQTGVVPFSLYDDMEGSVGAWFGEEAKGPGWRFKIGATMGGPLADYVEEEGTSGNWTYRKWASGLAECWGSFTHNTRLNTAWGSLYISATNLAQQNYPFTFIERPFEQASVIGNGASAWLINANTQPNTATKTASYTLVRNTSSSTSYIDYYVNIMVIGRWK